jgi:hypothetical protein
MTDWKVVSPWRSDWEPTSSDEWPPVDDRRPRLDEAEAAKVVGFLESGSIVLRRTKRIADPLSNSDALVVPMSIWTDGEWIWPDALTYFVKTHRIAPADDFMRYLGNRDFEPRRPTEAEIKAAWEAIQDD